MMKLTQALNVAVAGVLVLPAVTLQSGAPGSLREALDGTLRALETLAGVERRLAEDAPGAIEAVLSHTEQPLPVPEGDPGARDRMLETLRDEVAGLQGRFDRVQRERTDGGRGAHAGDALELPLDDDLAAPASTTTGLDDSLRAQLAAGRARPAPRVAPAVQPAQPARRAFEDDGFTADPLRLAQAYYRKGDFERAVEVLDDQAGPEATYWTARSLEKLGRNEEAAESYRTVAALEDAGPLASRAREDLEFLNWRLEFERKARQPR